MAGAVPTGQGLPVRQDVPEIPSKLARQAKIELK